MIKLSLPSHVQLPVHSEIRAAGGYPGLHGTRGELWVSGVNMPNAEFMLRCLLGLIEGVYRAQAGDEMEEKAFC